MCPECLLYIKLAQKHSRHW